MQLLGGNDWGLLGNNGGLLGSKETLEHLQGQIELCSRVGLLLDLWRLGLLELLHDALSLLSGSDASLRVVEKLSQFFELLQRGVISLE